MTWHAVAVKAMVLFAAAAAAALVVLPVIGPAQPRPPVALVGLDGAPVPVPTSEGDFEATWQGQRVHVIVARQAILDGVESLRGKDEATPCAELQGDLCVFALSGTSTYLGCTWALNPTLGASKDVADYDGDGVPDGRALDSCHHGQWDVYRRGEPVPGTPAPARLAVLDVELRDGALWATGFDGPTRARGP